MRWPRRKGRSKAAAAAAAAAAACTGRTQVHVVAEIDGRPGLIQGYLVLILPGQVLLQFSQEEKELSRQHGGEGA